MKASCESQGVSVAFEDSSEGTLARLAAGEVVRALLVDVGTSADSSPLELCPRLVKAAEPAPLVGFLAYSPIGLGALALVDTCLSGLISLIDSPEGVERALRAALAGEAPLRLPKNALRESPLLSIGPVPTKAMQPEDVRILRMLVAGFRDTEIGDEIGFSPSTVRHRVERIMHEWRISTRAQLAAWAVVQGLVDPSAALPSAED